MERLRGQLEERPVKLASLRRGHRDGRLAIVSRDLSRCLLVPGIAPTMQAALDDWSTTAPRLAELLALDDAGFRKLFSGSPIKRIGRNRFVRNCLYAAGNSGDAAFVAQVRALLGDPDPVVAEAAQWAAAELAAVMPAAAP